MVDLEEFAVTGSFGGIRSGAAESEVVAELGAAEFRDKSKQAGRFTLLYGDVEIWFDVLRGRVTGSRHRLRRCGDRDIVKAGLRTPAGRRR
jgi:hypothetical protein